MTDKRLPSVFNADFHQSTVQSSIAILAVGRNKLIFWIKMDSRLDAGRSRALIYGGDPPPPTHFLVLPEEELPLLQLRQVLLHQLKVLRLGAAVEMMLQNETPTFHHPVRALLSLYRGEEKEVS
jgi:hypothetical protein